MRLTYVKFPVFLFPFVLAGTAATITKTFYKIKRYLSAPEQDLEGNASDLRVFSYLTIKVATNNFSKDNKLGQGGFGSVYKVTLLMNGSELQYPASSSSICLPLCPPPFVHVCFSFLEKKLPSPNSFCSFASTLSRYTCPLNIVLSNL